MARIRTIKPEFFKNEQLADLAPQVRLLFIGLWTLADKEGKLEDRPKRIKAELFPYDTFKIDELLSQLQSAGFIRRYEFGDLKVIQISNFSKHQRITGSEVDSISQWPDPSDGNILETPGNTEETPRTTGKEGKGKEGKGRESAAHASVRTGLQNSNLFRKPSIPQFQIVLECFLRMGGNEDMAQKFFATHESTGWYFRGSPITNFASMVGPYIASWKSNDQKNGADTKSAASGNGKPGTSKARIDTAREW